ncbi:hypothetical protein [Stenotrophomonas sp.]|uniref:hypothetical protein n=1 Tax=Stenotrophomonas sp. TaxID=69392 RepID=UPI0028A2BDD2|nr:hypothetical protein [Stenotrophomonas sp.]
MAVLRRQLADIAHATDVHDPLAVRQARTRFIRTVLVWEFGPALREHPEWRPLMESIEASLDAQGAAAEMGFVSLLRQLK